MCIAAWNEVHVLALGQGNDKFLDERRNIIVAHNGTFIFLDVENRVGNLNVEVVFNLDLAAKAPMVVLLLVAEMNGLGGKNVATALEYLHLALATRALATACATDHNALVVERGEQRRACVDIENFLSVIYINLDGARCHEIVLGHQENDHQKQGHNQKYDCTCANGQVLSI